MADWKTLGNCSTCLLTNGKDGEYSRVALRRPNSAVATRPQGLSSYNFRKNPPLRNEKLPNRPDYYLLGENFFCLSKKVE